MAAESIWSGMFHAEAGRGNTASARSRDTVASHAISNEQRARKGPGQPAMNRSKQAGMVKKAIGALLVCLALALVHLVEAQQPAKVPRIGYVAANEDPNIPGPNVEAFRQGLR